MLGALRELALKHWLHLMTISVKKQMEVLILKGGLSSGRYSSCVAGGTFLSTFTPQGGGRSGQVNSR